LHKTLEKHANGTSFPNLEKILAYYEQFFKHKLHFGERNIKKLLTLLKSGFAAHLVQNNFLANEKRFTVFM